MSEPHPVENGDNRRLAEELATLKRTHAQVLEERDRLAAEVEKFARTVEELGVVKKAMNEMADDLRSEMESLRMDFEDYAEVCQLPEVKAYLAAKRGPEESRIR